MTPKKYVLAVLLLSLAVPAIGQKRKLSPKELPDSAFKLVSLKVTQTKRYTDQDILAATGLQIGQTAHDEDFRKAAQALVDSGVFQDVAYSFRYSPDGLTVEFQLTDNDKMIPAKFENFVWFSDQQLLDNLRQRLPLFKGDLPVGGNLADDVSEALQAMLIEHNVEGRADYLRAADEDGPIKAFAFSVSGVQIRVKKVEFTGAGAAELPALEAAASPIEGNDYVRSLLGLQIEKNLLPVYLQRGYLKAAFGDPVVKVMKDSPQETDVDLSVPVTPGIQYKVSQVHISGNQAFQAEKIRALLHVAPGQVANAVQLNEDLGEVKRLYGTKGYMAETAVASPIMDDAQAAVVYLLRINEGDVYKMGDLDIRGLDTKTTARLEENWKIRGGDVYDSSYPKEFVQEAIKDPELMGGWNYTVHEGVNKSDKTVDVSIRFDPQAR